MFFDSKNTMRLGASLSRDSMDSMEIAICHSKLYIALLAKAIISNRTGSHYNSQEIIKPGACRNHNYDYLYNMMSIITYILYLYYI